MGRGNAAWLKKQLIQREGLLARKNVELAARNKDNESLSMQVCELRIQLAEAKQQLEETRSLITPKKRKTVTPSSGARRAPKTAPAKFSATLAGPGGMIEPETPTKEPRFAVKDVSPHDPFSC